MNYREHEDEPEISFSGEIRDGKIIGLTATDNQGGEYEITITLEQTNSKGNGKICWVCDLIKAGDRHIVGCHQVQCKERKE